jgi:hypothetical protein
MKDEWGMMNKGREWLVIFSNKGILADGWHL